MKQQDQASTSFKEIIQRVVNAKVKAGLRSLTMVWELDARYFKSYRLSYNTFSKVQSQKTIAKESRTKESRPKKVKQADSNAPALPRPDEPVKLNCQEKKPY